MDHPALSALRGRAPAAVNRLRLAKATVFLACLSPLLILIYGAALDPESLGANPAEMIEHVTGDRAMQILLLTLAVTPLRRLTGWNWLIKFRRILGLFAFFYAVLHLTAYVGFDRFFDGRAIVADIAKRPFVTVGFAALLLMTPLAITSTNGWIKRLGGVGWNRLHKLVYPVAILGVVHYWWLVKRDLTWPAIYGGVLLALLAWRIGWSLTPRRARGARAKPAAQST